jgi:lysozyme
MITSAAGIALIKRFEGLRTAAYRDAAGVLTIGYGHTSKAGPPLVHEGMTITPREADMILSRDVYKFEQRVAKAVKVPLTQAQFDALVSFVFNTGRLEDTTLLAFLNRGNYIAVPTQMMRWTRAGGKTLQGLVNRRAAEAAKWNSMPAPTPPPTGVVAWLKSLFRRG